jgi:DNA-binding HxlR family transcriptional regulator
VELKSFADMDCSVAQCLEIVGDRWSLLVLRDCFLGIRRFDDFQRRLGISRNILQQRLSKLVANEIVSRTRYSEHPPRYEYRLTDKGRDLWPVITTMREWGDRYAAPDGPPIEMVHNECGNVTTTRLVCSCCGGALHVRGVSAVAGPGRAPRS